MANIKLNGFKIFLSNHAMDLLQTVIDDFGERVHGARRDDWDYNDLMDVLNPLAREIIACAGKTLSSQELSSLTEHLSEIELAYLIADLVSQTRPHYFDPLWVKLKGGKK